MALAAYSGDGHKALYPHINAARPRPLDPARYLHSDPWLVMISSTKERHEPRGQYLRA